MQVKTPNCGDRSKCPINALVELIGDQWSLLILRDMILNLKVRYSEFEESDEGVATNILSRRLSQMVENGLIEKHPDPKDGRAAIYLPTHQALSLIPLLLAAMAWSEIHRPATTRSDQIMEIYKSDPLAAAQRLTQRALGFRQEVLS
jgi:DNA-binding HxlR family transcriptional regulator